MAECRSRHDHFPRDDLARQRSMRIAAQDQDAAWRAADTAPGGLLSAMAAVRDADPATIIAALQPWIGDDAWIERRLDEALSLARREPFILPPVRLFHGAGLGGLILAECAPISLALIIRPGTAVHAGDCPDGHRAIFTPGYGWTRIICAGGARARCYRVPVSAAEEGGCFTAATASPCVYAGEQVLHAGDVIAVDQAREAVNIIGGTGDVVMVQLTIQSPSPLPLREYDGRTGRLTGVASSQRANSFRQMGLALLRQMERRDAAPLFVAELASRDFALRWQVMREFVALDAGAALPHLCDMATDDPHPELRRAAASARDLVVKYHADAAVSRARPCPM